MRDAPRRAYFTLSRDAGDEFFNQLADQWTVNENGLLVVTTAAYTRTNSP